MAADLGSSSSVLYAAQLSFPWKRESRLDPRWSLPRTTIRGGMTQDTPRSALGSVISLRLALVFDF